MVRRLSLIVLWLLALAAPAAAATVTYDTSSGLGNASGQVFGGTSATSVSFTVGANSNRACLVSIGTFTNIWADTFTVACGGATASVIASTQVHSLNGGGAGEGVKLWGATAPATGAAKTCSASWTTSTTYGVVGCVVIYNVDQSTPFANATNATSTAAAGVLSMNITSAANNMTLSSIMSSNGGAAPTPTQTISTNSSGWGVDRAAGASTVTHQWTDTGGSLVMAGVSATAFNPSIAVTGTATATITEADVVAGGKTIILTATSDTYVPSSVTQTISVIGTPQGGTSTGSANVTLTFSTAPSTNDVVVVWGGHVNTASSSVTPVTSGYTQVINDVGSNPFFGVWYKVMGGTPDTTVVMPGQSAGTSASAYGCIVLRNVDTTTPIDATTTTAGPTASTNPDAAAITPATTGAAVLALAVSTSNDAAPGTVTNYTVGGSAGLNLAGTDASVSGAYRLGLTGGASENPPAWSAWTTGTWKTATVALRPAITTPFDDARAAIRDGCDSAQSEGTGWDALKATIMPVANVVRTSSSVVTITMAAAGTYNITSQETLTCTVPAAALNGGGDLVATPTFTVDTSGGGGGTPACKRTLLGVGCESPLLADRRFRIRRQR